MKTRFKRELVLEGLNCSNCLLKVETETNQLKDIKTKIDYETNTILVILKNLKDLDVVKKIINMIVNNDQHQIQIVEKIEDLDEDEEDEGKGFIIKEVMVILTSILFLMAAIFLNINSISKLILYIISYLIVGGKILLKALKHSIHGDLFDENFLMSIATIGAFAISKYSEAVAVMLFYRVGELFQDFALSKSRKSIKKLIQIKADYANLLKDNVIKKVKLNQVNVDDIVIVKAGEKIPLDAIVLKGSSFIDASALTGESAYKEVGVGSSVLSGSINQHGVLMVQVTKNEQESTVSKILELVENANFKKAKTEKFITKFAKYYTPVVIGIAFLLAIIPPLLLKEDFNSWLYRSLIFLVISCPCALVISIPIGFFGGLGAASKKGIIVKGSNYLEALNNVDTMVFDKTGTVTKGSFKVKAINHTSEYREKDIIYYGSYAESLSNHPIANSIKALYNDKINQDMISKYQELSGFGVILEIDGKQVTVGNRKLIESQNIDIPKIDEIDTVIYLTIDSKYAGSFIIGDEIKEDSYKLVQEAKKMNIKTIMLTGDTNKVARKVADRLSIDEVHSELLPNEKVEFIEAINKNKNKKVAFIGDGINDAPALASSDIGIAMGGLGSDAAIEAADIVIMNDDPSKIITAIKIAKRTKKIVWQSIIFALSVKILFLVLGALSIAKMWDAVFADVGVSIIAILNAMRILNVNKVK